jgi:hypothetical protein
MEKPARLHLCGCRRRQWPEGKLELRAAEPGDFDAPRMVPGFVETQADRIKVSGAPARNFPAIAIANSIKDSSGKPFFTGTTAIYEPEAPSKESK